MGAKFGLTKEKEFRVIRPLFNDILIESHSTLSAGIAAAKRYRDKFNETIAVAWFTPNEKKKYHYKAFYGTD